MYVCNYLDKKLIFMNDNRISSIQLEYSVYSINTMVFFKKDVLFKMRIKNK